MDKVEMMAAWLQYRGLSTSKPFRCLSPQHEDTHPSMSFDRQHGRVRCFGCGVSWDVYDCEAVAEGAPLEQKNGRLQPSYRLPAVKKALLSRYGLSEGENSIKGTQTLSAAQNGPQSASQSVPEPSYRQSMEHVAAAQRDAAQTVHFAQRFLATGEGLTAKEKEVRTQAIDYLKGRGISLETAIKKGVGFAPDWHQPQTSEPKVPVLVFPTHESAGQADGYTVRSLGQTKWRYRKVNPDTSLVYLFGGKELLYPRATLAVVEGEMDALALAEVGCPAVALGSVGNAKRFLQALEKVRRAYEAKYKGNRYSPKLLLALDQDETGQKALGELKMALRQAGVAAYPASQLATDRMHGETPHPYKDVADLLQAEDGASVLKANFNRLQQDPTDKLSAFISYANDANRKPAIPTGFASLDAALGGGLQQGLYILGAVSSLGKTTMALQIADHIAQSGAAPVLYYTLEMTQNQLISRSLSRMTFLRALAQSDYQQAQSLAWTSQGILKGWEHGGDPARVELLRECLRSYASWSANLNFVDASLTGGQPSASQIDADIAYFVKTHGVAPVVFVDYLQIMASDGERWDERKATKESVKALKNAAMAYDTPIFLISSFNRAAYDSPVSQSSYKESGDIEYSADALLGLQFKGVGESGFSVQEAKNAEPRQIEAVFLKNRVGKDSTIAFSYDAAHNLYYEAESASVAEDDLTDQKGIKTFPASYRLEDRESEESLDLPF